MRTRDAGRALFCAYCSAVPLNAYVRRDIGDAKWDAVIETFDADDDSKLINALLDLELFPIKNPYVYGQVQDPAMLVMALLN